MLSTLISLFFFLIPLTVFWFCHNLQCWTNRTSVITVGDKNKHRFGDQKQISQRKFYLLLLWCWSVLILFVILSLFFCDPLEAYKPVPNTRSIKQFPQHKKTASWELFFTTYLYLLIYDLNRSNRYLHFRTGKFYKQHPNSLNHHFCGVCWHFFLQ